MFSNKKPVTVVLNLEHDASAGAGFVDPESHLPVIVLGIIQVVEIRFQDVGNGVYIFQEQVGIII